MFRRCAPLKDAYGADNTCHVICRHAPRLLLATRSPLALAARPSPVARRPSPRSTSSPPAGVIPQDRSSSLLLLAGRRSSGDPPKHVVCGSKKGPESARSTEHPAEAVPAHSSCTSGGCSSEWSSEQPDVVTGLTLLLLCSCSSRMRDVACAHGDAARYVTRSRGAVRVSVLGLRA